MLTTNSTITVVKTLPAGIATTYAATNIHLEVKHGNTVSLVHTPTIVNSTLSAAGSITFTLVNVSLGVNRISMYSSDAVDLDTAATLTKLGVVTARRVESTTTYNL